MSFIVAKLFLTNLKQAQEAKQWGRAVKIKVASKVCIRRQNKITLKLSWTPCLSLRPE
jgi:hypothetical protein